MQPAARCIDDIAFGIDTKGAISGKAGFAITGANGKTTAKDLTAAVLATAFRTHASFGSFNNEVGLPVTLLSAPPETQAVVAELGARHKGDVSELCAIARPDIVVVTNIGLATTGRIFGAGTARQMQFALKFIF